MAGSIRERLAALKLRVVEKEAEGLGQVRVRLLPMSVIMQVGTSEDNVQAMLDVVHQSLVDEQGEPVFPDSNAVAELDLETVRALYRAAASANGVDYEAAQKNSAAAPSSS